PGGPVWPLPGGPGFLSCFQLRLGRREPLLLSSTVAEDNSSFTADLTNPDVVRDGKVILSRGALHVFRSRVLSNGGSIQRIRVANHDPHSMEVPLTLRFDSVFADVFEVRGPRRLSR